MMCAYCGFEIALDTPDGSAQMADHILSCDKSPLVQILNRMKPTWDLAIGFAQECASDTDDRISPALKEKARKIVQLANRSQCGCQENQCCSSCDPEEFYRQEGVVQP